MVVQCLDLEDDHGDTGQRHGEVHPETAQPGHRDIEAAAAQGGGVVPAHNQHDEAEDADRQIGEDVQHLDGDLGQIDVKCGHADVCAAADGQSSTQHGHVAHAGQNDFFRPCGVRDERDVTTNDRHGGDENIHDQQNLADKQDHFVGDVVRRLDLIQSGKDFQHRISSILL